MEHHNVEILYRSSIVSIGNVSCRPEGSGWSRDKWSSSHKIVFLRSGAFVIRSHGKQIPIDPTDILFFNGGEEYSTSHPVPGGDRCSAFVPDKKVLQEIRGRYEHSVLDNPDQPFPFSTEPATAGTYLIHKGLLKCLPAIGPAERIAVDETALELLGHVIRSAYARTGMNPMLGRISTAGSHASLVHRVKLLLAAEFHEPLSLDRIARSANSSPYHLCRIFKRETGLSIHQYLTRLRLRMSLDLIGDGDLARVAVDLGFSSHSHFTEAFRREFGMTPSRMHAIASINTIRQISKNLIA